MGPRFENRGYYNREYARRRRSSVLQWVHGSRTVVNPEYADCPLLPHRLQWVHGSRTVVNAGASERFGPVVWGFNGSTVREPWLISPPASTPATRPRWLQWVHGSRTVVNPAAMARRRSIPSLQWVHGSRTVVNLLRTIEAGQAARLLQWVHGSRTVVNSCRR